MIAPLRAFSTCPVTIGWIPNSRSGMTMIIGHSGECLRKSTPNTVVGPLPVRTLRPTPTYFASSKVGLTDGAIARKRRTRSGTAVRISRLTLRSSETSAGVIASATGPAGELTASPATLTPGPSSRPPVGGPGALGSPDRASCRRCR